MIRRARLDDRRAFMLLWEEYLKDLQDMGGEIIPSKRTLLFFSKVFAAYTQNHDRGVCLIYFDGKIPAAVLLWGEILPLPIDTTLGRIAQGWGTYIRLKYRGKGLSSELRAAASFILREAGFNSVIGSSHDKNQHGLQTGLAAGFEPFQTTCVLDLTLKAPIETTPYVEGLEA